MLNAPETAIAAQTSHPPVGGFFERHAPADGRAGPSVLQAWTEGRPYVAFSNARSAFAALVAAFPQATVWLPAFLCCDMAQAALATRTRFYPVGEGFEPDLRPVETGAAAGDLVLVATYFGLPLSEAVCEFTGRRRDLRFVEDRAHALDAGLGVEHGWRLYSPRKLLGVADGGLLVAIDGAAVLPRPAGPANATLWTAPLMRSADPLGRRSTVWHAANQAKEAGMTVGREAITRRSLAILSRTSLPGLASARSRNWALLDRRLKAWSALPANPGAPPLGYVLRLEPGLRDKLLGALHAKRIFAAVHWANIAAPPGDFHREHQWSRELITLPCDHRYGEAEMEQIADSVLEVLG
jgi:hypothetical protein